MSPLVSCFSTSLITNAFKRSFNSGFCASRLHPKCASIATFRVFRETDANSSSLCVVKKVCTAALNAPSSGNPDDEDDDEDDEDDEDEEGSGADMFVAPLVSRMWMWRGADRRRRCRGTDFLAKGVFFHNNDSEGVACHVRFTYGFIK